LTNFIFFPFFTQKWSALGGTGEKMASAAKGLRNWLHLVLLQNILPINLKLFYCAVSSCVLDYK
jgi:hypothetical protein